MTGIAAVRAGGGPEPRWSRAVLAALAPFGGVRQCSAVAGEVLLCASVHDGVPEDLTDHPPHRAAGGRFSLLFDGRIDNRDEVAALTGAGGQVSDGMLAAELWARQGRAALLTMVGPFALIVWDAAERSLVAAVDPLGRRALAFHHDAARLAVASAPSAIFALGDVARRIDRQRLADHLAALQVEPARGWFEGIGRIPAAHLLEARGGAAPVLRRYWRLEPGPPLRLGTDGAYAEAAAALLDGAVRARCRSAGPVGAHLTGGLDSSLVAVTALKHLPGGARLPAFTFRPGAGPDAPAPPGWVADETPFVAAIAAMHPRIEPHHLDSAGGDWDDGLEDALAAGAGPGVSPGVIAGYRRYMGLARELGLRTVLTGVPGNLTLSWPGSGVVGAHARALRFGRALAELRHAAAGSVLPLLARKLVYPLLPTSLIAARARRREGLAGRPPWWGFTMMREEAWEEFGMAGREARAAWRYWHERRDVSPAARARAIMFHAESGIAEGLQADRATFRIEVRDPLGDRRLVEWCLRVPEDQYRRGGVGRWLARRLAARCLPAAVAENRLKGQQWADWHSHVALNLTRLRGQVEVLAADPDAADLIDLPRVAAMLDDWERYHPSRLRPGERRLVRLALLNAVQVGRVLRWVRGANS